MRSICRERFFPRESLCDQAFDNYETAPVAGLDIAFSLCLRSQFTICSRHFCQLGLLALAFLSDTQQSLQDTRVQNETRTCACRVISAGPGERLGGASVLLQPVRLVARVLHERAQVCIEPAFDVLRTCRVTNNQQTSCFQWGWFLCFFPLCLPILAELRCKRTFDPELFCLHRVDMIFQAFGKKSESNEFGDVCKCRYLRTDVFGRNQSFVLVPVAFLERHTVRW